MNSNKIMRMQLLPSTEWCTSEERKKKEIHALEIIAQRGDCIVTDASCMHAGRKHVLFNTEIHNYSQTCLLNTV